MSTKNRDIRHNFNWHARRTDEAIEAVVIIEGVECIYNPWVVEGPFVHDAYSQHPWSADEPSAADVLDDGFHQQFQGLSVDPLKPLWDFRPGYFDPKVMPFLPLDPLGYIEDMDQHPTTFHD